MAVVRPCRGQGGAGLVDDARRVGSHQLRLASFLLRFCTGPRADRTGSLPTYTGAIRFEPLTGRGRPACHSLCGFVAAVVPPGSGASPLGGLSRPDSRKQEREGLAFHLGMTWRGTDPATSLIGYLLWPRHAPPSPASSQLQRPSKMREGCKIKSGEKQEE